MAETSNKIYDLLLKTSLRMDKNKIIIVLMGIIVLLLIFIASTFLFGSTVLETSGGNVIVQLG